MSGSTGQPDAGLVGNACPFLRALAEDGAIPHDRVPLRQVSSVVADAFAPPVSRPPILLQVFGIGLIANGLAPRNLWRTLRGGVRLDALRGGPLDKKGAGSRVLDRQGRVDEYQLDRFDEFAANFFDARTGTTERGLAIAQLRTMMDANFARAAGRRRRIDRRLMESEWPVLLAVMGKPSTDGTYLSLAEIRTLIADRRLPERVTQRLKSS
ncbi:hypothetical protein ACFV0B_26935 [Streptomyces xanthophaeus]|uniref:hypothetical protein n=1 Tax=Streptomyces xanthophaeus TaxID=67385 RepID=UPI0036C0F5A1